MRFFYWLILLLAGCGSGDQSVRNTNVLGDPYLLVLGVAQDAGYPQAACQKACCRSYWDGETSSAYPACLALVDEKENRFWLFEATPDIREQLEAVYRETSIPPGQLPEGIFLTHAHIGHYTGLIELGREVIGARGVAVYAMPRMREFLLTNGPWSQLVDLGNIALRPLVGDSSVVLFQNLNIRPFLVPHRDEFSETVGFRISSTNKEVLFIPDIDKWEKWDRDILGEIRSSDVAFLDGTFFSESELPGRDMSEIPHPFIPESMALFETLTPEERAAVHFIHFNHTNALLTDPTKREEVLRSGYQLATEGLKIPL